MSVLSRMTDRPSRMAVGWFLAAAAASAVAALAAAGIVTTFGFPGPTALPAAFLVSTGLLAAVSGALARADAAAQREKQSRLRRSLAVALAAAILFLSVQAVALAGLLREADPSEGAGPAAFVFVFAALHALHAAAAVFWLVYVALRGFAGRYDHEYRFGLTACGWCWHALGAVWLVILAVYSATR